MGLALAVRLLYLLRAGGEATFLSPGMDAEIYRTWAEALLAGTPPAGPLFRAPLYPALIALLARLFGGDTFWPIRLLQVLLSAVSAGLLARLAGRWFGAAAGWIAGLGWAFYGMSIYFDGEGLIASLYTSLFILLLGVLERYRRRPGSLRPAALAAGLLALMTLLRANALAWWPVLLLLLLLPPGARARGARRIFPVAPLLAAFILAAAAAPVITYNLRHGGGFTISTQGGINLYLGNHPGASGAWAVDPDFGRAWTRTQVEERARQAEGKTLSTAGVNRHYTRRVLAFWTQRPGEALALLGRKLLLLANGREIGNNRVLAPYLREVGGPLLAFLALIGFPLAALLGLPVVAGAWRTAPGARPALLFALVHAAVVVLFFVNARYRFPLAPVLVLLAAHGAARLPGLLRRAARGDRRAALPLLLHAAAAALVLLPRPLPPEKNPQGEWQFHRGTALLRLGRLPEARAALREALRLAPGRRDVHLNLGVCDLREGRLDSAEAQFLSELQVHPGSARAANDLGVVSERRGEAGEAERYYRLALALDATHEEARLNLARLLDRRAALLADDGRLPEALSAAGEAAALAPENPAYGFNRAMLLAAMQRRAEAAEVLRGILRHRPDFAPARRALAALTGEAPAP